MNRNRRVSRASLLGIALVTLVGWGGTLLAQNTGTILGVAKDQTGAVLPGASITVRNVETGISRTTVTGNRGEYRVPALAVGTYEVHAELSGFQTGIRQGITLTVGREAVVDFTLNVGDVTEQVTVTGEAPLIETTTATVGGVVDGQQMRDISLNARSFIELVPLQAGAVLSETGGQSGVFGFSKKLAVVGTRYTSNSFLLDGADINDSSGSSGSAAETMAGVETVREFRVITNAYDAEYGRHTGGVISAITKSGTNEFHGSLFEFLRNDNMDAANWADNALGGGEKPEYRRNQFGGSVGGPILRDKTFFFGSYEGLREGLGRTETYDVPGIGPRSGILRGQTIPLAATTRPYLESFPVPNQPDRADGTAQFVEGITRVTNQDFWTARVDHHLSDSDSIFVRFTKDDADRTTPDLVRTDVQSTANRLTTIEETHIFSPALLSRTHLSFNRTGFSDRTGPRADRTLPKTTFTDNELAMGGISVTGLTRWGGESLIPRVNALNTWQFKEEAYYTRGRHSTKFGFQYERFQYNMRGDFHGAGTFNFQGLDLFMRGEVSSANFVKPGSDSARSWIQSLFGFYFQDDVSFRPGLNLNFGLRYEFITVPAERYGRSATIRDLSSPHLNTVRPDQTDVGPLFENPSLKNLAPRVGFAWDVFGTGKTSFRGGVGMFHDQVLSTYYVVPGNRVSPFFSVAEMFQRDITIDFPNAFFSQRDFLTNPAAGGRPQIDGIEYFLEQPAVYKWSMDIEQQIAPDTTLETGYIGTRSTHLMRGNLQLNTSPAEFRDLNGQQRLFILIGGTPDRDNPFFNRFRWRLNDGSSHYHAYHMGVTKRFRQGFQFHGAYTYARSTDDGSAFLGSGDYGNDRQPYRSDHEWALSAFDIRHSFNSNLVYDLPGRNLSGATGKILGGWNLSASLRLNTGNPNSITADRPRQGSLQMIFVDGPSVELVPSGNLNASIAQNPNGYVDMSQFCHPARCLPSPFFQGNVGVNTLIGPGIANLNLTVRKDTPVSALGEGGALQFRAEFFNLLNRVNFSDPETNLFDRFGNPRGDAGLITSTRTSSRQIQLALKLVF